MHVRAKTICGFFKSVILDPLKSGFARARLGQRARRWGTSPGPDSAHKTKRSIDRSVESLWGCGESAGKVLHVVLYAQYAREEYHTTDAAMRDWQLTWKARGTLRVARHLASG